MIRERKIPGAQELGILKLTERARDTAGIQNTKQQRQVEKRGFEDGH